MTQVSALIIITINLILCCILFYIIDLYHKKLKALDEKKEKKIDTDTLKLILDDGVKKVDTVIDSYIKNAADIFTILELSQNDNQYLTIELQDKMVKYIVGSVMHNMTAETIRLISLTHVIHSEDDLKNLITLKSKIYVLNFTIDYNKPIE